jgi:hypothetical protein
VQSPLPAIFAACGVGWRRRRHRPPRA